MKNIYLTLRETLEKNPVIYSSITFILLLIITSGATFRLYDLTVAEERQKAFYAGDAFRDQIELTLNHGLSATQTIAFMIEHGSLPTSFERVAEKILLSYPVLNAIELGPNGIVSHAYPYEQNKNAIGFNILGDSIQRAEAKEAIKKQKLIFAGPLNLVQGGVGVVGRLPVFIANGHGKHFWGFSLVVIKIDRLLTLAKSDELLLKGYDFQLRRTITASSTIDTFSNKHLSLVEPVILKVNVPNGQWELLVAPTSGWNALGETLPFAASSIAFSCILGLFVWYVGKQPEKLSKLVTERTEELRFSEEKLRISDEYNKALVNTIPDLLFVHDVTGKIVDYHSPVSIPLLLPPEHFLGKHFRDFLPPDVTVVVEEGFQQALQTKEMSMYTYSLDLPEGKRHYEARLLMIDDDKVLNIIRDITDTVTAENEIKLLNADLENRVAQRTAQLTEAVAELEAFSYSVSHDLRAPLRSIDGFTAILSEQYSEKFNDEGKRLLANVHNSIDKMDRLIKGLLMLSRARRGELQFTELSMEPLIQTAFEECTTAELRKRIVFNVLPLPTVVADLSLIQQVWTNLISNAVKYSGNHEHPNIEIGAKRENERIIFYVRDNGAGFDPKYSNKLFGIFQRLHADDEFKGLGIGLSIVKRIIQRHGGTVWAEGKKNEGATFYFSIPTTVQV